MTQPVTVRVNVRPSKFPLRSSNFGRSIITRNLDQHNVALPRFQGTESQHNIDVPQVIYMENVIPVAEGLRSVCYVPGELPCLDAIEPCCNLSNLRKSGYLAHGDNVTTARVQDRNYIFIADDTNPQLFEAFPDCSKQPVPMKCLKWHKIKGIASLRGRMIAWDSCTVYWSNIGDNEVEPECGAEELPPEEVLPGALDFCPSLTNGAGSAKPNDLKSDIIAGFPMGDGLALYTCENVVYMQFNSDDHFPFRWKEIPSAGGIRDPKHVAWQSNTGYHYAWTSNGLQKIWPDREASLEHPQVSEFLEGNIIEDYIGVQCGRTTEDEGNDITCEETPHTKQPAPAVTPCNPTSYDALVDEPQSWSSETQTWDSDTCFESTPLECPQLQERVVPCDHGLDIKVRFVGAEYLAISYGGLCDCEYEYVLLWDRRLQRWGKLKHRHTDVFECPKMDMREQIGFLHKDCSVCHLSVDHQEDINCRDREVLSCQGVVIFGRYQLDRDHQATINGFEIERVHKEADFRSYWLHSYDGRNWEKDHVPVPVIRTNGLRKYDLRLTGKTHALKLIGTFVINSILLTFTNNGR